MQVTSNMQQMEILLVILFLSGKKFHAKQIVVLTSFTILGPDYTSTTQFQILLISIFSPNILNYFLFACSPFPRTHNPQFSLALFAFNTSNLHIRFNQKTWQQHCYRNQCSILNIYAYLIIYTYVFLNLLSDHHS